MTSEVAVDMSHNAKILADSISPDGVRLTTFEVTFPRIVLAEFNTHRMLSRNSASSRAIPVEKMIQMVMEDPYIPTVWGKNQKGMQASEVVDIETAGVAHRAWLRQRDHAVDEARFLSLKLDIHKQTANRLLEPFMWHTVIVTATDWDNFFHLRNHPAAQPEIQIIARMMQQLYTAQEPKKLSYGSWHLPLIDRAEDLRTLFDADVAQVDNEDSVLDEVLVKISAARCARVSYLTHDGKRDPQADIDLHDRLLASGHMSPFEHVARPVNVPEQCSSMLFTQTCIDNAWDGSWRFSPKEVYGGNFRGWVQYRKTIPGEADMLGAKR